MRALRPLLASFILLVKPPVTLAEQFLGEETNGDSPSEPYNYDKNASEIKDDEDKAAAVNSADPNRGQMYFSLGLSPGVGLFSASLTVGYLINRYVVIDTTGYYMRYDRQAYSGEQYGPEVSLILRLANPTILTPFIGAGSGYTQWTREENGARFDDGGSVTIAAFGGLNIRLARHFGLQVKRKQTTYLSDPPRDWENHDQRDAKSTIAWSGGFYAAF